MGLMGMRTINGKVIGKMVKPKIPQVDWKVRRRVHRLSSARARISCPVCGLPTGPSGCLACTAE